MSSFSTNLTVEQIASFERDGYLVLENFWDAHTVDSLRQRMHDLVCSADLSNVETIFSTDEGNRAHSRDSYFLESGRAIRYFWEQKAWDPVAKKLTLPATEAINKVGHGLHDLDPVFEKVSYTKQIGTICRQLGQVKPLLAQSMYIFKHARVGGEVTPHQDGTFLYTEPQSCIGFWWALDDCTKENGCLWIVPGSHKEGVPFHFKRKSPPDFGTELVATEPSLNRTHGDWNLDSAIPLFTSKGSLVVLHAAVVHFSNENNSDKSRHAYSIHVVDGKEGITYPQSNWLQRPDGFPFREIKL